MRWQRIAQFAIICFVLAFITLIAVSMRRQSPAAAPPSDTAPQAPRDAQVFNPGGGLQQWFSGDRKPFDIKFGSHVAYADGRHVFSDGITVTSHRTGKNVTIQARSAEVIAKGREVQRATFKEDVRLASAGELEVESSEASYVESEGIVRIPGAVTFTKGRLSGSGVGATYDMNREVFWLLDKATIHVTPGKDGTGRLEGSAAAIGLARLEHYVRLAKDARLTSDGRDLSADEITVTLTDDDERIRMLQLRGNSRMAGGSGGPQSMSANDIDVAYGEDGRTVQSTTLTEAAVVQLEGGKRISGNTITIGMAPDGATVTQLTANANVQVDLPAESGAPAKVIRSATLVSSGTPDSGLQTATFSGKVEFRERRPARRNVTAVDRTASADTLSIETKPGLGEIQKADFRGNVRFTDAPALVAQAPRGIYHLAGDRIELMPAEGVPGSPPRVSDGKISVGARTIEFTMGTRELRADTDVRSTLLTKPAGGGQASKVPSLLKQNEPVNVTSNRLHYQGSASKAVYSGNVIMWQEGDSANIKGDTLTLDDKTGNLQASGNVTTEFLLEEVDAKTDEKKHTRAIGKAETFVFDDKRRLATYTVNAQFDGPQGNLAAERIEVLLEPGENQVQRLEAFAGEGKVVTVKEAKRTVTGLHLTYTAGNQTYLMIGSPVTVIEEKGDGNCQVGIGGSLEFQRGVEMAQLKGVGDVRGNFSVEPCAKVKK